MIYPHASWEIESTQFRPLGITVDAAMVGQTIWLLTLKAPEALPDNQEVINLFGGREMKELADDDETRAGFLAYGLLPADWNRLLGSAVDKLGALSND